jgi:hypothetical protein
MPDGERVRYRPLTLADLSTRLTGAVDEPTRQLWLQEFLEEYRWEAHESKAALISERPGPCGDRRYDAFLGALAEHLAYHDKLPMPRWAQEPDRFLESWWFPVTLPSVRADAIVHSPAAFRRRGIFIGHGALGRA